MFIASTRRIASRRYERHAARARQHRSEDSVISTIPAFSDISSLSDMPAHQDNGACTREPFGSYITPAGVMRWARRSTNILACSYHSSLSVPSSLSRFSDIADTVCATFVARADSLAAMAGCQPDRKPRRCVRTSALKSQTRPTHARCPTPPSSPHHALSPSCPPCHTCVRCPVMSSFVRRLPCPAQRAGPSER